MEMDKDPLYQPTGYVRETDQGNLVVNDDVEGGGFEIGNALFQKFILNSMISIDSIENAKKALGTSGECFNGGFQCSCDWRSLSYQDWKKK